MKESLRGLGAEDLGVVAALIEHAPERDPEKALDWAIIQMKRFKANTKLYAVVMEHTKGGRDAIARIIADYVYYSH